MTKQSVRLNGFLVTLAFALAIVAKFPLLVLGELAILAIYVIGRVRAAMRGDQEGSRAWVGNVSVLLGLLALALWWSFKLPAPLVAFAALVFAIDGADVYRHRRISVFSSALGLVLALVQLGVFVEIFFTSTAPTPAYNKVAIST